MRARRMKDMEGGMILLWAALLTIYLKNQSQRAQSEPRDSEPVMVLGGLLHLCYYAHLDRVLA